VVGLALLTLALRVIPHTPNIAALGALAVISGFYLTGKFRYILPLLVVFISDFFIGFYHLPIIISVYLSYAVMSLIGSKTAGLVKTKSLSIKGFSLLGGTVLGSVAFYLITNAAVWAFSPMYLPSLSGLISSYYNALPFFRNSLLSDLTYVSAFAIIVETTPVITRKLSVILGIWRKESFQKHP